MVQSTASNTEQELDESFELEEDLTEEQINALEAMITRRMENTGEDREYAVWHIRSYLQCMV